ncbi:DUF6279 family lipoprotein [Zestomonas carbonaria]|uniref:Lipoprotein n=1 Tax=Zestomonas carbonaria TaxID=2762745 RepID=A0A7U7EQ82_9GAMM|nr:DUF6279 family lipoprotein [Pseudomonas carbonaria]CAD5109096.1 hypothetical protein PSEWESI4_03392 [Pseudomonas carbonaria]
MFASVPRIALFVLLALLLGSCSRVDLAYRNLDRLALWWVDDYLELSGEQKNWMRARLQDDLAWHCTTQLPRYVEWLDEQRRLAERPSLLPEEFEARFDDIDADLLAIAEHITPSAVELLRQLSDRQIAGMARRFDENLRELHKKYLAPSPERQIAQRGKRMEQRLRPWLGRLSPQQRARIQVWATAMNARTQLWLDNRRHWQQSLLTVLASRADDGFPQRIARLLQEPESIWTEEYRRSFLDSRSDLASLLADLFNGASEAQRNRLATRLAELRDDLQGLSCAEPAQDQEVTTAR